MQALTHNENWKLDPARCFNPEPTWRQTATELYETVKDLPLVCPHGHVSPDLLADPAATLGSPADLFIIPDHYVFRMLYSQGIGLETLGIPASNDTNLPVESDHRAIWQRFAENFHLFRGTPTGLWLTDELINLFGINTKLNGVTAQVIYDQLSRQLASAEFKPLALYKQFKIEVLCTTDPPWASLEQHTTLQSMGLRVLPTMRPDGVINLDAPGWVANIEQLAQVCRIDIKDYASFIRCLEDRRTFFKQRGATATDQGCQTPYTERLPDYQAEAIFERAFRQHLEPTDASRFSAHMIMEMARMSLEDGLVMQLHAGSHRNHNQFLFEEFGPDKGADIPVQTEWTNNLYNLLNTFGNDRRLSLVLFGLDESAYSRELAPLAGHYPALLLGPPWWFFDSVNGMNRYLDRVIETAGVYNTAGFNDDTRAFASIPARHDVWRRVTCNWLAGQHLKGLIDREDAGEMALDFAYRRAKQVYQLDK